MYAFKVLHQLSAHGRQSIVPHYRLSGLHTYTPRLIGVLVNVLEQPD